MLDRLNERRGDKKRISLKVNSCLQAIELQLRRGEVRWRRSSKLETWSYNTAGEKHINRGDRYKTFSAQHNDRHACKNERDRKDCCRAELCRFEHLNLKCKASRYHFQSLISPGSLQSKPIHSIQSTHSIRTAGRSQHAFSCHDCSDMSGIIDHHTFTTFNTGHYRRSWGILSFSYLLITPGNERQILRFFALPFKN